MGIVGRGGQRLLDVAARLVERGERRIERLHRRLYIERRLGVAALQPPHRRRQHWDRRLRARHHRFGLAQILGDLFRLHHAGAAAGERGLLARLRRELRQFLRGMAQPVCFAPGPFDLGAVGSHLLLRGAAQRPQPRHLDGLGLEAAIGVEQPAVSRGLDQRAVVVLAMDFDQRGADGAQHLHRHRLVIEEGAGAAVGQLDTAQDQFVLRRNVVGGQDRAGRMIHRHVEGRRHLPLLGTLADQAGIAAGAQRQREGIEQDRLAGAGLAGQHRQTRREIDIEAVDQDDVSDRKPGQHQGPRCRRVPTPAHVFASGGETFNTSAASLGIDCRFRVPPPPASTIRDRRAERILQATCRYLSKRAKAD